MLQPQQQMMQQQMMQQPQQQQLNQDQMMQQMMKQQMQQQPFRQPMANPTTPFAQQQHQQPPAAVTPYQRPSQQDGDGTHSSSSTATTGNGLDALVSALDYSGNAYENGGDYDGNEHADESTTGVI
jgi:outer membrane biosynthesis protein TonB